MKKRIQSNALLLACALVFSTKTLAAGIPVIDATNLTQNTMNVISTLAQEVKQASQYATQLQQYQTQLQQYSNMIQNTQKPNVWILHNTTALLNSTRNLLANTPMSLVDNYLKRYVTPAYHSVNACLNGGRCTPQTWNELVNNNRQLNRDRIDQLNSWFSRQQSLEMKFRAADSDFERLKSSAQTANGQVQAIGYANMMIAQVADINLQLRDILMEMMRYEKEKQLQELAQQYAQRQIRNTRSDPYQMRPVTPVTVRFAK